MRLFNILNMAFMKLAAIDDYIIESGETNGWTWEKRSSGICKFSGIFTYTVSHYIGPINGWYGFYKDIYFPFECIKPPTVTWNVQVAGAYSLPGSGKYVYNDYTRLYCLSTVTGAQTCIYHVQAGGYWKNPA